MNPGSRLLSLLACALCLSSCTTVPPTAGDNSPTAASWLLLHPDAPQMNRRAPDRFDVLLNTSKGRIVIEVRRDWAPHGADRFFNLVGAGYYDGARFFRVIQGRWAQFGVNGDPQISAVWRTRTFPDDPRRVSNVRGTVAFAFAVPNGRTTQVFINLRDNSATHDPEPFVPFGMVIEGMDVADALDAEYGEAAGGGIRAGKQAPLFDKGNRYLEQNFPRLDYIRQATVGEPSHSARRPKPAGLAQGGVAETPPGGSACRFRLAPEPVVGFAVRRGLDYRYESVHTNNG